MDNARDNVASSAAGNGSMPASPPPRGTASEEPVRPAPARRSNGYGYGQRSAGSAESTEPKPSVSKFIEEIRGAFSARFYLFELEAKRAAWSAAYMMAFAVGAALLGVTAWLILIGALIIGAVAIGVPWLLAVVVAIALHAVAIFFLVRGIRSMVENLTFAATRRTLSHSNSPKAEHGRSA